MARVRVWPGGTSGGFPGLREGAAPPRGVIRGWTAGAARRNSAFLWSVDPTKVETGGWSVTLTMGGLPDNAERWALARRAVLDAIRASGAQCWHWVTEWTEAGRPHMHMAVVGGERVDAAILLAWFKACDRYAWPASIDGQHIKPMHGPAGWLEYLSKHATRGVKHYQRQGAPEGWESTGRLWGHGGDWPRSEAVELEMTHEEFWRYRRLVLAYQRQKVLNSGIVVRHPKALRRAIGARYGDPKTGAMAGLSGWVPEAVALALIEAACDLARSEGRRYEWEN